MVSATSCDVEPGACSLRLQDCRATFSMHVPGILPASYHNRQIDKHIMLQDLLPAPGTFGDYLLRGTLTFLVAALAARALAWLIWRISVSRPARRHPFSERRRTTLRYLIGSL